MTHTFKIFAQVVAITLIFTVCGCKANDNSTNPDSSTQKYADKHGVIHTSGTSFVDKNNQPIQLTGMSLFWSQWGGSYYNSSCVNWLVSDWKCNVIRVAMGIENGGYLTNKSVELAKAYMVIDAAINAGIYVIIDWHDHHAESHLADSKAFFGAIAQKYGNTPNIIYEIYNEPLAVSWSTVLKPYAWEVMNEIRKYDKDNLIIVGTPNWSQDVDVAANDKILDTNVAYSLHYYSSTHKQDLRNKAITAINKGLPLFVTEYGISEASGTGVINYQEAVNWFNFIDAYKLSSCNWSVIDKDETSAALKPGTTGTGNWKSTDLSESGTYIRARIQTKNKE